MHFTEDKNISQITEAYALDAIDVARNNFGVILDWSEKSIKDIESILDLLHQKNLENPPPEEMILKFSKVFGSYVGEIYRRNHGGKWGVVTMDGESFPGLQGEDRKQIIWPWGKVNNRIKNGSEDNVWDYYQLITQENIK